MIPNGTYRAVVDRFENDLAALEVEGEDERYELAVPTAALPEEGQAVDAVLVIEVDNGELVDAVYKPKETEGRKESAQSRYDRLSKRPPKDE
jgi:hypothetical protein